MLELVADAVRLSTNRKPSKKAVIETWEPLRSLKVKGKLHRSEEVCRCTAPLPRSGPEAEKGAVKALRNSACNSDPGKAFCGSPLPPRQDLSQIARSFCLGRWLGHRITWMSCGGSSGVPASESCSFSRSVTNVTNSTAGLSLLVSELEVDSTLWPSSESNRPAARTSARIRGFKKLAAQVGTALVVALCHETASGQCLLPREALQNKALALQELSAQVGEPKERKTCRSALLHPCPSPWSMEAFGAHRLLGPSLDATAANSIAFPAANHLQTETSQSLKDLALRSKADLQPRSAANNMPE